MTSLYLLPRRLETRLQVRSPPDFSSSFHVNSFSASMQPKIVSVMAERSMPPYCSFVRYSPAFCEGPEGVQISAIRLDEIAPLRSFDNHRNPAQARIGDQAAKRREADRPLADVLMTVHTAPQFPLAVIEVNDLERGDAHNLVEQIQHRMMGVRRPDIVAGREQMTGIQADAGPLRESHLIQKQ